MLLQYGLGRNELPGDLWKSRLDLRETRDLELTNRRQLRFPGTMVPARLWHCPELAAETPIGQATMNAIARIDESDPDRRPIRFSGTNALAV